MKTKHKISVSCLALVFITFNCLIGQDFKKTNISASGKRW